VISAVIIKLILLVFFAHSSAKLNNIIHSEIVPSGATKQVSIAGLFLSNFDDSGKNLPDPTSKTLELFNLSYDNNFFSETAPDARIIFSPIPLLIAC
jgi:hypothetical protein